MEKGEHFKRQNRPTMLQLQYLKELEYAEKSVAFKEALLSNVM